MSRATGEALVIFGGETIEAPLAWRSVDGAGRVTSSGSGDSPPAFAPSRTVLVLPGAEGQVRRIEAAARTEAQARAAAAFAFEGAIAGGADVAYAVGEPVDRLGARLAVAVDRGRLLRWLERCREAGADPHRVLLDFTAWPAQPNQADVVRLDGRVMVAAGPAGGFAIEPELAATVFGRWLAQTTATIEAVTVWNEASAPFAAAAAPRAPSFRTQRAADPLNELAVGAACAPDWAPNLRQGELAPSASGAGSWRLWRFAAALAVLSVLLQTGALALAGWRDRQASERTLAAAEKDLRAARPDIGRITNLSARVRALANALGQADAHPVIAVSEPLRVALGKQATARVDSLSHQSGGKVSVRVSAPTADGIAQVAADLRAQGLLVEETARAAAPDGRAILELSLVKP